MRSQSLPCVAGALGIAALLGSIPYGLGSAQERKPAEYSLGQVFVAYWQRLTEGSEKKLFDALFTNAREVNCIPARPKFRIVTGPDNDNGDGVRFNLLEAGRKEEIARIAREAGFDDAATLFTVEFDRTGRQEQDGHTMVSYETVRDERPPSIEVTPRREKVNPGEQVRIKIEASDDATPYDRGIQRIQLRDLTNGGLRVGGEYGEYGLVADRCDPTTLQRTVTVTYTVPRNPPALIVLEARAEDKADNSNDAFVLLATGDFAGRFEGKVVIVAAPGISHEETIDFDFALKADAQGGLTGNLSGRLKLKVTNPGCPVTTLSQGSFQSGLSGARLVDGRYSINATDPDTTPPEVRYCTAATRVPYHTIGPWGVIPEAFLKLRPEKDGTLRSSSDAGHFITYSLTMSRVVGK